MEAYITLVLGGGLLAAVAAFWLFVFAGIGLVMMFAHYE